MVCSDRNISPLVCAELGNVARIELESLRINF